MSGTLLVFCIIIFRFRFSEVPRSAKKFISEEKMASYLQGLHIAGDTNYQQQQLVGKFEILFPVYMLT